MCIEKRQALPDVRTARRIRRGAGFDRYFDHPEEDEWWNISAGLSEDAADGVPVVSIAATDAEAWETPLTDQQDNKLSFTVTRSGNEEDGDFDEALTVLLHPPAGTATPTDDYTGLPSSVTIAAGQSSATFDVTAVQDNKTETDETLALCLKAAQNYRLAAYTADGTIHDVSIDLIAHRTGNNFGQEVTPLVEDSEDPKNYVILTDTYVIDPPTGNESLTGYTKAPILGGQVVPVNQYNEPDHNLAKISYGVLLLRFFEASPQTIVWRGYFAVLSRNISGANCVKNFRHSV